MIAREYTKNPSGLLDLKEIYEKGKITKDEYSEKRLEILNSNLFTREIKYCKCGNPTMPNNEFCKDCI